MFHIDTSELNRLAVDLGKAPAKAVVLGSRAIRKTAADIEGTAKQLAPVDTGNLRNSISSSVSLTGLVAEIGPTADYAAYVEEGTSKMAPQPYLAPAFSRHSGELVKAFEQISDKLL